MKQTFSKLWLALALMLTFGATASAEDVVFNLTKETVTGGTLTLKVNGSEAITAAAGATVTVIAKPESPLNKADITITSNMQWGAAHSRRLAPVDPSIVKSFKATPVAGKAYTYEFTMPANDVIVSALFSEMESLTQVPYIDAEGNEVTTPDGVKVYKLDGTEGELGVEGQTTWYVVQSALTYTEAIKLNGATNIIVTDGSKMSIGTAETPISNYCFTNTAAVDFSVFGQKGATGQFGFYNNRPLDNHLDDVVITSCNFVAHSPNGLYCKGNLTTWGANVTSTGSAYGLGCLGNINVTGGKLTATSNGRALYVTKDLNLTNCEFTAETNDGIAVQVSGNLSITGGKATVKGIYSFFVDYDITITDCEQLTANGSGNDGLYSQSGKITIEGSKLNILSAKDAISANQGVAITQSDVTAEGSRSGIASQNKDITITQSNVVASGGYCGIEANDGQLSITGGKVTAKAPHGMAAINGYKGITIEDCVLTATSSTYGLFSMGGQEVSIDGGQVTIMGNTFGIYTANNEVSIGLKTVKDFVYVSSYYNSTVTLNQRTLAHDGLPTVLDPANSMLLESGTVSDLALVKDKTLRLVIQGSISFLEDEVYEYSGETITNTLHNNGDGKVTYSSSNESIATVDPVTGEVTIVGPGEAVITATVKDGLNYHYEPNTASFKLIAAPALSKVLLGYTAKDGVVYALYEDHATVVGVLQKAADMKTPTISIAATVNNKPVTGFANGWFKANEEGFKNTIQGTLPAAVTTDQTPQASAPDANGVITYTWTQNGGSATQEVFKAIDVKKAKPTGAAETAPYITWYMVIRATGIEEIARTDLGDEGTEGDGSLIPINRFTIGKDCPMKKLGEYLFANAKADVQTNTEAEFLAKAAADNALIDIAAFKANQDAWEAEKAPYQENIDQANAQMQELEAALADPQAGMNLVNTRINTANAKIAEFNEIARLYGTFGPALVNMYNDPSDTYYGTLNSTDQATWDAYMVEWNKLNSKGLLKTTYPNGTTNETNYKYGTALTALNGYVQEQNNVRDQIQAEIDGINAQKQTLQTQIDENQAKIDELQGKIDAAQATIDEKQKIVDKYYDADGNVIFKREYAYSLKGDNETLTLVKFLNDDIKTIGKYAFANCVNAEFVGTFPATIKTVSTNAFANTKLKIADFSTAADDHLYIQQNAFAGTPLETLKLEGITSEYVTPQIVANIVQSLKKMDKDVIYTDNCGKQYITEAGTNSNNTLGSNGGVVTLPTVEKFTSIYASTFEDCIALTTIEIPAQITTIGESAFENCVALATITFAGDQIATIGDAAFFRTAIPAFDFSNQFKLATIGDAAFADNCALTTVNLPADKDKYSYEQAPLYQLARNTFYGDINLTTVTFNGNMFYLPQGLFRSNKLAALDLSKTKVLVLNELFQAGTDTPVTDENGNIIYEKDENGQFILDASNEKIPVYIRETNKTLMSVTLPEGLLAINNFALAGLQGADFKSLTIPSSVVYVGIGAFRNSSFLEHIKFPGTKLQFFERGTFEQCLNLIDVELFTEDALYTPKQEFTSQPNEQRTTLFTNPLREAIREAIAPTNTSGNLPSVIGQLPWDELIVDGSIGDKPYIDPATIPDYNEPFDYDEAIREGFNINYGGTNQFGYLLSAIGGDGWYGSNQANLTIFNGSVWGFDDTWFDGRPAHDPVIVYVTPNDVLQLKAANYEESYSKLMEMPTTIKLYDGGDGYSYGIIGKTHGVWIPYQKGTVVFSAYQDGNYVILHPAKIKNGYYKVAGYDPNATEEIYAPGFYWQPRNAQDYWSTAQLYAKAADRASAAVVRVEGSKTEIAYLAQHNKDTHTIPAGMATYEEVHMAPRYESTLDYENQLQILDEAVYPATNINWYKFGSYHGEINFWYVSKGMLKPGTVAFQAEGVNGLSRLNVVFVEPNEATAVMGIKEYRDMMQNGTIYNLQGVKVTAPVKGQMYIQNGKKFIQK